MDLVLREEQEATPQEVQFLSPNFYHNFQDSEDLARWPITFLY